MNHPSNSRKPSSLALGIGFALLYTSWGTTYLPTRIAVHDENMPPLLFGGVRIICAGLVLLGYQACRGGQVRIVTGDFGKILGVSLLLFVVGTGLLNLANQTVESSACAVLAATTPLWLGLWSMCWPGGERLTARGWLGLLVGMAGVVLLLIPRLSRPEDFVQNIGVFFILGSAASWAMGSVVLRHVRLQTSHLTTAAYQMIFGGAGLTVAGLLLGEANQLPERIPVPVMQAFAYLFLVGSLVGFVSFNWLLSHVAAARVGTYAYVNPLIAVLVGWAAGEDFTVWLAAGIGVILLGVFLVRGGERPAPAATEIAKIEPCKDEEGSVPADWPVAQVSEPS